MSKQCIHIFLDNAVYLAVKSKKINMSKVGNDLFKQYVEFDSLETPEESIILSQLNKLKLEQQQNEEKFSFLTVQLTKVREDREEKIKQRDRDAVAKLDALRLNNPMRDLFGGGQ